MGDDCRLVSTQYSDYLKVNLFPGCKAVEDSIDETVTRLEEYSSLIDMVRSDPSIGICSSLLRNKDKLEELFEKVRNLEAMVQRIKQDVDKVEELVDNAESDLGISTEGKLRYIFKPFFKRANSVPPSSNQRRNNASFKVPELFETKDYFPNNV